jgi:hypothetical protein
MVFYIITYNSPNTLLIINLNLMCDVRLNGHTLNEILYMENYSCAFSTTSNLIQFKLTIKAKHFNERYIRDYISMKTTKDK